MRKKIEELSRPELKGWYDYLAERRKHIRYRVLTAYGGKCVCCGESNYELLVIDHINGGGCKQLRELKGGRTGHDQLIFYNWLIKNGFPKGLQVLCHNCNFSKDAYGYCPHKSSSCFPKPMEL